jgi:phosphatidylglycerophosphate synthase
MLSRWARHWSPKIFVPINQVLAGLGITPNGLTAAGLLAAVISGLCIAFGRLPLAAGFLVLSGLLDSLDGEMARMAGMASPLGPFIDSVADHYGDFAIYFGLVWLAIQTNQPVLTLLVLAAMFGSLVGSHIRSRAGMIGVDTKTVGMFTRMERNIVLFLGLISGWLIPALAILVVANNVSALQRVVYTLKAGKPSPGHE